jgi:uncharacterized protein
MESANTELLTKIEEVAKSYLDFGQHDWDHTERVKNTALHIGAVEGADLKVIEIAALLHDIGRKEELQKMKVGICHAERGAELAREILNDFEINEEAKKNIYHSILVHRARKNRIPETLEAKVLFDADKLDSLGAIGIGRLFHFAGQFGGKVHNTKGINVEETAEFSSEDTAYREYIIKLRHLKDRFYTKEGRRIGNERHDFMAQYFDRF